MTLKSPSSLLPDVFYFFSKFEQKTITVRKYHPLCQCVMVKNTELSFSRKKNYFSTIDVGMLFIGRRNKRLYYYLKRLKSI